MRPDPFSCAPWTVATYMIEGGSSRDRAKARGLAFEDPVRVDGLLDVLVDATVRYLAMQARSGADVLKLFDSWTDGLPEDEFERLVIGPHRRIVEGLRRLGITTPVIGFARGAGALLENYAERSGVSAAALDVQASAELGRRVQRNMPIQGALDPLLLRAGGERLRRRVDQMLQDWGKGPYIFNLGHGVVLDTPVAHVAQLVEQVTSAGGE